MSRTPKILLTSALSTFIATGVSAEDYTSKNTELLKSLTPNWNQLLAVNLSPKSEPSDAGTSKSSGKQSAVTICTKEKVTAGEGQQLTEGSILNPGDTTIWPGALLRGNQRLAEGLPDPLILPRGPVTITVKLPGLGEARSRRVENPTNRTVGEAIEEILIYWHDNVASDGYAPPLRVFSEAKKSYSSDQIGVELNFAGQWSSGGATAKASVESNSESTVVFKAFRQIYYTVEIEEVGEPGSFFAADYELKSSDVSNTNPPTYVRSVDYGRMIIAQMRTSRAVSKVDAEAAMNYAAGSTSIDASASALYESITEDSSFSVLQIGGGATDQQDPIDLLAGDIEGFRDAISGGFVFSRENPGEPISYKVASVADRRLQKMSATADYIKTECEQFPGGSIEFKSTGGFVSRFALTYMTDDIVKAGDQEIKIPVPFVWASGNKTSPYSSGQLWIPGDAYNISIVGENTTGLVWDPVRTPLNKKLTAVPAPGTCYKLVGTTLNSSSEDC